MEGFSEAWRILAPERLMVSADAEPHRTWQKTQARYCLGEPSQTGIRSLTPEASRKNGQSSLQYV